ncbi:hypothetical protein DRV84_11625 [Rhodosalinus sediminis]|uniref:Uncharacterized protein n=1 Tax=Rhodosalinus sediminis TaxID=1940533 RepID=A0A3D9BPV3_9RHOB|nr:hypothetical protein [Rhodosalinus sediminis]REC55476.1 hypothetical protein DRV84_11625 [Rhodosalinus sediminis]
MTADRSRPERAEPPEPRTHPAGTRRRLVEPHRRRRAEEPAAAPIETDGEAGDARPRDGAVPVDPVEAAPRDPADLRAGPGDAGAQGKPRVLPERRAARDRDGWRRVVVITLIGAALLLGLRLLL